MVVKNSIRRVNPWRIAGGLAAVLAVGAAGFPAPAHAQAEAPPPPPEADLETATESAPSTGGRVLQLPDISFIGAAVGKLSTDRRDADRNRLRLDEAELGIQSYVYPGIRADAFLVAPGHEQFQVELEEGYLTHEQLPLRFTGRLGKFFVPFGRDNQKHPHSCSILAALVWRSAKRRSPATASLSWLAHARPVVRAVEGGAYPDGGSHDHDGDAPRHRIRRAAPVRGQFYTLRGWSGVWAAGRLGGRQLGARCPKQRRWQSRHHRSVSNHDIGGHRRYGEQANRLLRGEASGNASSRT